MVEMYKCQVCGSPMDSRADICDICGWEDEFGIESCPDEISCANDKSLTQARAEWQEKLKIEKLKRKKEEK